MHLSQQGPWLWVELKGTVLVKEKMMIINAMFFPLMSISVSPESEKNAYN